MNIIGTLVINKFFAHLNTLFRSTLPVILRFLYLLLAINPKKVRQLGKILVYNQKHFAQDIRSVSYTHLTLPTKRIV